MDRGKSFVDRENVESSACGESQPKQGISQTSRENTKNETHSAPFQPTPVSCPSSLRNQSLPNLPPPPLASPKTPRRNKHSPYPPSPSLHPSSSVNTPDLPAPDFHALTHPPLPFRRRLTALSFPAPPIPGNEMLVPLQRSPHTNRTTAL